MRDKFLLILLFFLLMAAIPLGFLARQNRTSPQAFATPDEAADAQAASAASLCKSSFCDWRYCKEPITQPETTRKRQNRLFLKKNYTAVSKPFLIPETKY